MCFASLASAADTADAVSNLLLVPRDVILILKKSATIAAAAAFDDDDDDVVVVVAAAAASAGAADANTAADTDAALSLASFQSNYVYSQSQQ